MSNLVMIDSQIFIWGIKGFASPGQEHLIEQATSFIEWLSENDYKILLPTPLIAELLSAVKKEDQKEILALLNKNFVVAPFDAIASEKCGELINLCLAEDKRMKIAGEQLCPRNEIKFDCMLVSIAITKRASKIYSNDKHLKKFACGQIDVLEMPFIPKQQILNFVQKDVFGNDLIKIKR
jgi:predicted nucleic acid-binding protein